MQLQCKDLRAGYGEHIIIDKLNLTLPEGKVTALIGPNGCGKSTLLKTLCRIQAPLRGAVLLDGKNIRQEDTRALARKLAILPQNPVAPEGLSVQELVSYGRAPYHSRFVTRSTTEDNDMVAWALQETDMEELAQRPLKELSGGQLQRAWIAMVIAQNTEILCLDEPTSFLDISHQLEVLTLIRHLNEKYHKTIVMVIHELNAAARFSDYLLAMKDGNICYAGTPADIFHAQMLADVFGVEAEVLTDAKTGKLYCLPYAVKNKETPLK